MSDADIRRLRADLDVMEQAADLRLPFDWLDVWFAVAMVPCGVVLSAWAAFGPPGYSGWGLTPLIALVLVAAARWTAKQRRDRVRGRERSLEIQFLVGAAAMTILILWERWLGLSSSVVRGSRAVSLGMMCVPVALSARSRRRASVSAVAGPLRISAPLLRVPREIVGRRIGSRCVRTDGSLIMIAAALKGGVMESPIDFNGLDTVVHGPIRDLAC